MTGAQPPGHSAYSRNVGETAKSRGEVTGDAAPLSIASLVREATRRLEKAGVASARSDAEELLALALGDDRQAIVTGAILGRVVDEPVARSFDRFVARRAAREPLQHITGTAHFRHLTLRVGPGVFIPRPETEVLVESVLDDLRRVPEPRALDLCTGSGAVALAIATEMPKCRVVAVERSFDAFVWAELNRRRLGVENLRIERDDVARPGISWPEKFDVIVSNPPYVPDAAVPRDPEVRRFDPPAALYSGTDGLDLIRRISVLARAHIARGGVIAIEHGEEQGEAVRRILEADGWADARTIPDLTGRDRVTRARWVPPDYH